jgi:hypothetical protein
VARKTINAIPSQYLLFYQMSAVLLFIYVTVYSIYLDFLHLYFSECRWRGCLGRCVHSYMLLTGGSNPAMVNVLFFVLIFFSLRFFLRLSVYNTGELLLYDCKLLLLNCPLLSKFDKLFFNSRGHFVVRANFHNCVN